LRIIVKRRVDGPSAPELGTPVPTSFSSITVPLSRPSTGPAAIASYSIERATAAGGPFTVVASGPAVFGNPPTQYVDGGLIAGGTYYYRARATDTSGRVSAYSAVVSGTTLTSSVTVQVLHYDDFSGASTDAGTSGRWSLSDDFAPASGDVTVAHSANHCRSPGFVTAGSPQSARVQLTYRRGISLASSDWYLISGGTEQPHRNELAAKQWPTSVGGTGWNGRTQIGNEYWYGISIYLPDGSDSDPAWVEGSALGRHFEIVLQWHDTPDSGAEGGRNPPLNLKLNVPNGQPGAGVSRRHWVIQNLSQAAATAGSSYDSNVSFDCGDAADDMGGWTDWVFRWLPHYTTAGILQVWKNDVLVVNRINLPNAFNDIFGPYQKFGFYTGQRGFDSVTGAPLSVPADWPVRRVAYYGEHKMLQAFGNPTNAAVDTTNYAYQQVKPRGSRASGY
jgi:hypothetical protein